VFSPSGSDDLGLLPPFARTTSPATPAARPVVAEHTFFSLRRRGGCSQWFVGGADEPLLDPAVVLAPDLALVEVGLRRVDGDERDLEPVKLGARARVARSERVLEVEVADVAGVVVAGHAHRLRARERRQLLLCERILVGVALVGEVAGDDDEVGRPRR
jgi:hypothetical protein